MTRVLVTGGSAAASFVEAVSSSGVVVFAGDTDANAVGLRAVAPQHRVVFPRTSTTALADAMLRYCVAQHIDVLVPTRDVELLALSRCRDRFAAAGVTVLLADTDALRMSIDRWLLHRACESVGVLRPRTAVFSSGFDLSTWVFPLVLVPRFRTDPRPRRVLRTPHDAERAAGDHAMLLQESLPGERVDVDVVAQDGGCVVNAVHRGWGRTEMAGSQREVIDVAERVVGALRLSYACTVTLRRDRDGALNLIDVAPRFTASMDRSMHGIALGMALGQPLPEEFEASSKPTLRLVGAAS